KNVLKYDDVLNRHRGRIYEQRRQVLEGEDLSEQIKLWIEEVVEDTVNVFTEEEYAQEWDLEALTQAMAQLYQTEITADELRKDPLVEYTGEGEVMFTELGRVIRGEVVLHLFHAELAPEEAQQQLAQAQQSQTSNGDIRYEHETAAGAAAIAAAGGGEELAAGG